MSTNCLKIAFGCQARMGKSAAVHYLVDKYGGIEKTFASSLYDIMYHAQGVCNFDKKKDRKFLQMIGTWARDQDPDVWINTQFKDFKFTTGENVYVSYLRFPNEFDALKKMGFITVRIIGDYPFERRCSEGVDHSEHRVLSGRVQPFRLNHPDLKGLNDGVQPKRLDFGNGDNTHESELSLIFKNLKEWDYIIENKGSLNEFYENLDKLVKTIKQL